MRRSSGAVRRSRILLAGAAIAVVVTGLFGVLAAVGPGPPARSGAFTEVQLPRGAGVTGVAANLKAAGVIRSEMVFQVLARLTGAGRSLKAGEYAIPSRASAISILADLEAGRTIVRKVTLPEGLTSAMVVRELQAVPWLTGDVQVPEEGTLLPETYRAERGDSRQSVLDRMRTEQQSLLDRLWASRVPGLPLATPQEAVILASIVEKETGVRDERRRVAGVFINRLRMGMRLQSDPTVIYAVSRGEPLGRGIRASELASRSPWNTYAHAGLPPTPIANPGRASLEAVLNPLETREIFFVADGTGGHAFAETLEAHNANVARWRQIERAQGGGG
ncbi:endolytic transglycosylase MltG [Phenylobacterium sp.]|uniref:endolytic transglycosylase MltG n=1 Tax=Phenylobacterium sp. TaxID=1871053 RepID=UPI0025D2224D|nr:endolytic transglycosylase MltG [Phenylobacterium sp.]MCA6286058.1 endolytic transglycosylase MltG [Phenylobacterium sp.]MCA6289952.1 endolytic transglycosylase MltG [Phenylobacterium sp.]MCA6309739.1 endolytic transglycosylase MltG [Phenylobacterium sp.]MCA6323532.1 endolytic transglycosylase MltG [Phenylobacterium sp.]MCA6336151.1 endolytic transglycosylase MltG [Phenylobacterium sp.]